MPCFFFPGIIPNLCEITAHECARVEQAIRQASAARKAPEVQDLWRLSGSHGRHDLDNKVQVPVDPVDQQLWDDVWGFPKIGLPENMDDL